jgi:hypothetical protein
MLAYSLVGGIGIRNNLGFQIPLMQKENDYLYKGFSNLLLYSGKPMMCICVCCQYYVIWYLVVLTDLAFIGLILVCVLLDRLN